jgi:Ca2+/Na+ antiporter
MIKPLKTTTFMVYFGFLILLIFITLGSFFIGILKFNESTIIIISVLVMLIIVGYFINLQIKKEKGEFDESESENYENIEENFDKLDPKTISRFKLEAIVRSSYNSNNPEYKRKVSKFMEEYYKHHKNSSIMIGFILIFIFYIFSPFELNESLNLIIGFILYGSALYFFATYMIKKQKAYEETLMKKKNQK